MARLQEQFHLQMRAAHYAMNTEKSYRNWIKRFLFFNNMLHPKDMAEFEVSSFLSHLATREKISQSTQRQALSAILFLYREMLGKDLVIEDWITF